jgi:hypothetical protein
MDINGNPQSTAPVTAPTPFKWQALKDLQLPPELVKRANERLRRLGFFARFSKKWRRYVEEEAKLQYFYGGRTVALLDTPEWGVIVALGHVASEEFERAWNSLSREEQRNSLIYCPSPVDDDVCWM